MRVVQASNQVRKEVNERQSHQQAVQDPSQNADATPMAASQAAELSNLSPLPLDAQLSQEEAQRFFSDEEQDPDVIIVGLVRANDVTLQHPSGEHPQQLADIRRGLPGSDPAANPVSGRRPVQDQQRSLAELGPPQAQIDHLQQPLQPENDPESDPSNEGQSDAPSEYDPTLELDAYYADYQEPEDEWPVFTPTCYRCGVDGHLAPDCPDRWTPSVKKKVPTCYSCGVVGHYSSNCPKKLPGTPQPAPPQAPSNLSQSLQGP